MSNASGDKAATMVPSPALTVGMPVYNSATHIRAALDSLISQTFQDFELVISDNASTDATKAICEEYARRDSRVRYVRQPQNVGLPNNYNFVVSVATGRYFKWASSNDVCMPTFLESCVQELEAHPEAVLAYPQTMFFDDVKGLRIEHEDNLCILDADPVERFRQCDQRLFYNNPINGVFRTGPLRASTLHWAYPSSDLALMPELCLYGTFVEVPGRHFHRRMELGAMYGSGSRDLHAAYFPNDRYGSRWRGWRQIQQMLCGISRAPITMGSRLRLLDYLARRAWWKRGELGAPFRIGSLSV